MGLAERTALGRYELLVELGRGGMAELFAARLPAVAGFTKLFAIKRILPHLADDKVFVELFLNEGKIAGGLSHPNICQVFELGLIDDELFLAMEYLEGVAWHELLAAIPASDPVRLPLTAGVIAQAAEGLHHAHAQHVIHRDVSPHNLFVTTDGICKVLDFGVAKLTTDGPRTRTGVLKGKLPYMSPEQIAGEPLDPRSDVFALGVVAWESLTGARLFDRSTDFLIWKAITEEPVPVLRAVRPDLPAALEAVVARALDRDRTRRFASARDFAAALCQAAGPVFAAPQIANVVRGACVAQLAARAAAIREALAGAVPDASASATIRDPGETASVVMRRDALVASGQSGAATAPALRDLASDARPTADLRGRPSGAGATTGTDPVFGAGGTRSATPESASATSGTDPIFGSAARSAIDLAAIGRNRISPIAPVRRRPRRWGAPLAILVVGIAGVAVGALVFGRSRDHAAREAPPTVTEHGRDRAGLTLDTLRRLQHVRDGSGDGLDRLGELVRAAQDTQNELAALPATYRLDSDPPAQIYVDDKLVDTTPIRIDLPAGVHHVRAIRSDGRSQELDITLEAGAVSIATLAW